MDKEKKSIQRLEQHRSFLQLIQYIKDQGYTQREIAERIGVSEVVICRYISGLRDPKYTVVKKICDTFNISDDVYMKYYEVELEDDSYYSTLREMDFKDLIKGLTSKGITQREIADRLNVTEVSISRYISGTRVPKESIVKELYKAYGEELKDCIEFYLSKQFLDGFKKLDDEDKKIIIKMEEVLLSNIKYKKELNLKMTDK